MRLCCNPQCGLKTAGTSEADDRNYFNCKVKVLENIET